MPVRNCSLTALLLVIAAVSSAAQSSARPDTRIRIERIAGGTALIRNIEGSYTQHPAVFADLLRVRDRLFAGVGDCFGIYPMDPDAVDSPSMLRWQVGVRVQPRNGQKALAGAPKGYRIITMPEIEAAVIDTRVESASIDGLAMFRWMAENGYVQVGPTRMEYRTHEGNPLLIPAKIIVPVRKRPSGVRLPV